MRVHPPGHLMARGDIVAPIWATSLHHVTAGNDAAVALLHDWPQIWYMRRDLIPGLAEHYRVIAPDLRGLGDASRPVGGYGKKTRINDVWRLAHDVLGEQRCSLRRTTGAARVPISWRPSIATRCATW